MTDESNRLKTTKVPEIDIYRTANLLIREHGDQASIEAAQRADAMLDKGDLDGKTVWLRVLRAVRELQGSGARGEGALTQSVRIGDYWRIESRSRSTVSTRSNIALISGVSAVLISFITEFFATVA